VAAVELRWAVPPQTLAVKITALGPFTQARLGSVLAAKAAEAEADAKTTAPWTDRTGAARNGLVGSSRATSAGGEMVLAHSVDYGIYLELAHGGNWAAVIPTLQRTYPRVISALGGLW
jgi:hypothetical protein